MRFREGIKIPSDHGSQRFLARPTLPVLKYRFPSATIDKPLCGVLIKRLMKTKITRTMSPALISCGLRAGRLALGS